MLCVQARVTNTSRHLATAVEVYANGNTVKPTDPGAPFPAATAHSVNLATLASWTMCPWHKLDCSRIAAGQQSQVIDCGPDGASSALEATAGMRAFLIRSGDKDWGLLYGAVPQLYALLRAAITRCLHGPLGAPAYLQLLPWKTAIY